MGKTYFFVSVLGLLWVLNGMAPRKGRLLLVPSFFGAWLTIELAPWLLGWTVVGSAAFIAGGALDDGYGWAGMAVSVVAAGGLVGIIAVTRTTTVTLEKATEELDPDDDTPSFPRSHVVFPFLMRHRQGVTTRRNITFAEYGKKKVRLDVVRAADAKPGDRRPGILQIHGGGWVFGDKREQGIPLLQHLAANGWVGINANYRLSPRVAFPEHLIDLKKAIAWYREHAEEHGADPKFLAVTGGSAGGHLTALVALTANDPAYQPGFESVDTSVTAAVPFYGVYDLTDRDGHWHKDTIKRFIEPMIMKRKLADDPEAFAKASPLDQVRPDAPPFFIIHGNLDTLAPVEYARAFAEKLRAVAEAPVVYAEMKGAQHAFDVFPSFRTARVIEAVERFLRGVHNEYRRGRTDGDVREEAVADSLVEN